MDFLFGVWCFLAINYFLVQWVGVAATVIIYGVLAVVWFIAFVWANWPDELKRAKTLDNRPTEE